MFRFNQTIIREPTVCASLKLQYWRQLKYFVIKLFGRVAVCYSVLLVRQQIGLEKAIIKEIEQNQL